MVRRDFLEELTPNFPPKTIYSYDENYQYHADRQMLMDEVLVGTFNSFLRKLKEPAFSYKITADEKFFWTSGQMGSAGRRLSITLQMLLISQSQHIDFLLSCLA
jgi:hypothetical protein